MGFVAVAGRPVCVEFRGTRQRYHKLITSAHRKPGTDLYLTEAFIAEKGRFPEEKGEKEEDAHRGRQLAEARVCTNRSGL